MAFGSSLGGSNSAQTPYSAYAPRPTYGGFGGTGKPTPFTETGIGTQVGNELYNPETGGTQRTGAQKGRNAGEALKALQEASGLNLLGSSSSSGSDAGGGYPGGAGIPRIAAPDNSEAQAAVFARAKDKAGQNSRAALTSLRGALAGRGMLGAGVEGGETAKIVGQAAGGLGDVNREQAIQEANRQNRFAEMGYQGDITQRGQDLSLEQQRRALEAQRQAQSMEGLLGVINSSGLLY